jgi:hypothetical protein
MELVILLNYPGTKIRTAYLYRKGRQRCDSVCKEAFDTKRPVRIDTHQALWTAKLRNGTLW